LLAGVKFTELGFTTQICTKLLRLINPSANNSANYVKKLPIIIPDYNTIIHINKLLERLRKRSLNKKRRLALENEKVDPRL
jgi:hypothetical protein